MVKFNRTTEYGLIALSYIRGKAAGEVSSAREIADSFGLPFEILAKTLQRLKEQGVIASTYGTRGGYVLSRDLNTINLADFIGMMEGPISIVACAHMNGQNNKDDTGLATGANCEYLMHCNIKSIMGSLNERLYAFLNGISLEELTRAPARPPFPGPSLTETALLQGEKT